MKIRRIFAMLLCIILVVTTATQAFAASGSYNFHGNSGTPYVVTTDNAPLRKESHNQGAILTRIAYGQVIYATRSFRTAKGTTWLEIRCYKDSQPVTAYLYSGNATQLYYNKYNGSSGSIVTVCKSLGINSSYTNRTKLAKANNITSYKGTASQNTNLVNLAKQGKLIRIGISKVIFDSAPAVSAVTYFPKYTGNTSSIVTALKAVGAESSYAYRCTIAACNNISGYAGTSSQNLKMLSLLKSGKLVKPGSATTSTTPVTNSGSAAVLVNANANLSVSNKAKENGIKFASKEGQRSAAALNTVIDQYNVASNKRYAKTKTATYCNIFAVDVMLAMDLQGDFSHWLKNNVPATSTTKGAYELNVNATYNWINNHGTKYGWRQISAQEAQNRANAGYPTIAIWKNTSGGSGHIAVVRPEGNGYYFSAAKGPVIAQAGASNFNYGNVINGFGKSKMAAIQYWTHE